MTNEFLGRRASTPRVAQEGTVHKATPRPGIAAAVLILGLAATAKAQAPIVTRPLDTTTVVRLHLAGGGTGQGRLVVPYTPGSPTFRYCPLPFAGCTGEREVVLDASRVTRVEVQVGTRAGRGFVIGSGVASLLIVPFFVAAGSWGDTPRVLLIGQGVLVSLVVGGGLGALIGSSAPSWGPAP